MKNKLKRKPLIIVVLLALLVGVGLVGAYILNQDEEEEVVVTEVKEDPTKGFESTQIELNKIEEDKVVETYTLALKVESLDELSVKSDKSEASVKKNGLTLTIKPTVNDKLLNYESIPVNEVTDFTFDTELVNRVIDPTGEYYYYTENLMTDEGACEEGAACAYEYATLEQDVENSGRFTITCKVDETQTTDYCDTVVSSLRLFGVERK